MSKTVDPAKAPLIIRNKLQPAFNSSHHVGEHKAVSIRSMYNPSPNFRQSNAPLSPQLMSALNGDIKKELGKKTQVGVNTVNPLIRLDDYNREQRKRLSSYVIKRNQRLTNSRYTNILESKVQEQPSTRLYFFDPTFSNALSQMN